MARTNPAADLEELRTFVRRLAERGIYMNLPNDTLPQGAVIMSPEEVVRQTNPVVMAPDGKEIVALEWGDAKLYTLSAEV